MKKEFEKATSHGDGCSILMIDDDRELCLATRDVLEFKRHRVETVHSASRALAACGAKSYDVALLDIGLPDLSGTELLARLEAAHPELEILIITGRGTYDNAVRAVSRSTVGYLTKPIDFDRLFTILDGIVERKHFAAERAVLFRKLEEQNAELERYAYSISHDLKSPLITIQGFLGFLEIDLATGDTERIRADLDRVHRAADSMFRLLDDLLDLSRVGRVINPVEEVSIEALVREAADLSFRPSREPVFELRAPGDLPAVRGDRVRLLEVFQNLLENAVRYMGEQPRPRVEVDAVHRDKDILCSVRDNGIGIDPRYYEKIFGLFEQLTPGNGGTGVGLTLVRRILEEHGGNIWVESEGAEKGSTFFFTLPLDGPTDVDLAT